MSAHNNAIQPAAQPPAVFGYYPVYPLYADYYDYYPWLYDGSFGVFAFFGGCCGFRHGYGFHDHFGYAGGFHDGGFHDGGFGGGFHGGGFGGHGGR